MRAFPGLFSHDAVRWFEKFWNLLSQFPWQWKWKLFKNSSFINHRTKVSQCFYREYKLRQMLTNLNALRVSLNKQDIWWIHWKLISTTHQKCWMMTRRCRWIKRRRQQWTLVLTASMMNSSWNQTSIKPSSDHSITRLLLVKLDPLFNYHVEFI